MECERTRKKLVEPLRVVTLSLQIDWLKTGYAFSFSATVGMLLTRGGIRSHTVAQLRIRKVVCLSSCTHHAAHTTLMFSPTADGSPIWTLRALLSKKRANTIDTPVGT